jgi:HSP20 family protein
MESKFPRQWMWSDAFELLDRAQRMHREVFRPARSASGPPAWEPPVDVLETDSAVMVLVALPGVDLNAVEVRLDSGALIFSGVRSFPKEMATAVIHRLELPQGRFERRIPLPPGQYNSVRRAAADGCLSIILEKAGALRG